MWRSGHRRQALSGSPCYGYLVGDPSAFAGSTQASGLAGCGAGEVRQLAAARLRNPLGPPKMKTLLRFTSLLGLTIALAAPLSAAPILFTTWLSGDQEVPPRETTGHGQVDLWFDDSTLGWSLSGAFEDLVSDSVAAHIHGPATTEGTAGVLYPLTISLGAQSGIIGGFGTFTPEQAGFLRDGLLYVNLHSVMYPAGEIRGQLSSVPDAASFGVTGLTALFLLGAVRLRQRVRG